MGLWLEITRSFVTRSTTVLWNEEGGCFYSTNRQLWSHEISHGAIYLTAKLNEWQETCFKEDVWMVCVVVIKFYCTELVTLVKQKFRTKLECMIDYPCLTFKTSRGAFWNVMFWVDHRPMQYASTCLCGRIRSSSGCRSWSFSSNDSSRNIWRYFTESSYGVE